MTQIASQMGLTVMVIIGLIFVGAILGFYHLPTTKGNFLGEVFLMDSCITGSLLLILRRARCPVCKNIFVGKTEPRWFSVTCKNCGRRSGDTH
jgi:hypothetical protein